jgi:hypothetical protein
LAKSSIENANRTISFESSNALTLAVLLFVQVKIEISQANSQGYISQRVLSSKNACKTHVFKI